MRIKSRLEKYLVVLFLSLLHWKTMAEISFNYEEIRNSSAASNYQQVFAPALVLIRQILMYIDSQNKWYHASYYVRC